MSVVSSNKSEILTDLTNSAIKKSEKNISLGNSNIDPDVLVPHSEEQEIKLKIAQREFVNSLKKDEIHNELFKTAPFEVVYRDKNGKASSSRMMLRQYMLIDVFAYEVKTNIQIHHNFLKEKYLIEVINNKKEKETFEFSETTWLNLFEGFSYFFSIIPNFGAACLMLYLRISGNDLGTIITGAISFPHHMLELIGLVLKKKKYPEIEDFLNQKVKEYSDNILNKLKNEKGLVPLDSINNSNVSKYQKKDTLIILVLEIFEKYLDPSTNTYSIFGETTYSIYPIVCNQIHFLKGQYNTNQYKTLFNLLLGLIKTITIIVSIVGFMNKK